MATLSPDTPRRSPGRLYLMLGLSLAALGILTYIVQIKAQRLITPWYMPIAAALGLVFVALSLWKKRNVWRVLALLLVGLLAGAEWAFLLATRLPAYTGPVVAGEPFPVFTTTRADGETFTERDLEGDQNSVLVFFRGRW